MVTACFAGGVLFLRFQLAGVRDQIQARASSLLGMNLEMEAVVAQGFRGLRIDGLKVRTGPPDGTTVAIDVPQVYVYIDFLELVYGRIVVDDILLDGATIHAQRPIDKPWVAAGGQGVRVPGNVPFRIRGQRCNVYVENAVGDARLTFGDVSFDVSRPVGATDLTGMLRAYWGEQDKKQIGAKIRYASVEDFDLRIEHEGITVSDISALTNGRDTLLESGRLAPKIRLSGYPDRTLIASLEADFENLSVVGRPAFVAPMTGNLKALANYDISKRLLDVATARVAADQLSGAVDGTVDFSGVSPRFDLRLRADQLPFSDILDYALASMKADAGEVTLDVSGEYNLALGLQGTLAEPSFVASTTIQDGAFRFKPEVQGLPEADLNLGGLNISWDSATMLPTGSLRITGGSLRDPLSGLEAQDITGSLSFAEDSILFDPLSATVTGNPIVGSARYDLVSKAFTFELDGAVANLEQLSAVRDIPDLSLSGAVGLRCKGTYAAGGLSMDMAVDATQAAIGFEWWFQKPVGVGTTITGLNLDYTPNRSITFSGSVSLGTSPINATVEVLRKRGKWALETIRAKGAAIDAATANKCLAVPYTLAGGQATELTFEYQRVGSLPKGRTMSIAGHVDHVLITPDGGDLPLEARALDVDVFIDNATEDHKGRATLKAAEINMPPFGELWFVPLEPPTPELRALYPAEPRDWVFTVDAAAVEVPPWVGQQFSTEATDTPEALHLKQFQAAVGEGTLTGTYTSQKADNLSTLNATWTDVPARYLIEHLDLPEVLTGTATGRVAYTVDDDDPNTLKGDGSFEIRDGRFSPEFVFEQLTQTLQGEMNVLPPSLDFSRFASTVLLSGDKITSNGLTLEGQGITIAADGFFIIDGDMDYRIKVSLTPQTAQEIPLIRNYFNIQGHKLSQNTIDLEFQVSGPTFRPQGSVAGLPPVGVTLVSGAFEMTSEAVKIIDLPRQLLLDLFKIGGGIVGSQRQ